MSWGIPWARAFLPFSPSNIPSACISAVFGGLGIGMVTGAGDWEPIGEALLAEDPATITHPRGQMFRKFADQTRSDRIALAALRHHVEGACSSGGDRRILQPVLVAVALTDDIARKRAGTGKSAAQW